MKWTKEASLAFINIYKDYPCIWNLKDPNHKDRIFINDAWENIKLTLHSTYPCTVQELKIKKKSLMAIYNRCKAKIRARGLTSNVYKPVWFAYSAMDSFLGSIDNSTMTNQDEQSCQPQLSEEEPRFASIPSDHLNPSYDCNPSNDSNSSYNQEIPVSSSSPIIKTKQKAKKGGLNDEQGTPEKQKKSTQELIYILKYEHSKEDKSQLFGRFITKKLSKMSDERLDDMIINISSLFYNDCLNMSRAQQDTMSVSEMVD